jgi:mannose/fructose/N-acetylgalactosamine-specific phosphotransferase system component IIC
MIGMALVIFLLLVTIGIALLLAALIRRSVPREELRTNNEAVVTDLTVIGVIYGVFLAFVIFSLWQQRTVTQDHVETESSQLYLLFRLAREFPAPNL